MAQLLAAVRLGGGSVGWGSDWSRKGLGRVSEGAWCGGPEWIIVSSIGYEVLSGKMQVERQLTSFTLKSLQHSITLSFISVLSR